MGGVAGLPWRDGRGQIAAPVIVSDAKSWHRVPQSDTSSKQKFSASAAPGGGGYGVTYWKTFP